MVVVSYSLQSYTIGCYQHIVENILWGFLYFL